MRSLLLTALVLLVAPVAHASTAATAPTGEPREEHSTRLDYPNNFTLLFGLNQPLLLKGFNFAFTHTYGRVIFEYSMGVNLDYPGFLHNAEERGQAIRGLYAPWTLGPGVGYRFTDWMDVRLEPKANRYEVTFNTGEKLAYTSFSLGAGAYFRWYPFSSFVVEPSVRYWPRIASTLKDSGLVARRVGRISLQLFAAPTYLARRGTPSAPKDLEQHDWGSFPGGPALRLEGLARVSVRPAPRLVADDMFFLREALRRGVGIGALPTFLAEEDVMAGQLVRVLPRWSMPSGAVYLVFPSAGLLPRKTAAFRDYALEVLETRGQGLASR